MFSLTERSAEALVADQAFAPGLPGLVGVAVDLLLDDPGVPESLAGSLTQRPPLRHGFLTARSPRVLVVSGPPSPGVDAAAARMADDLPMPLPLIGGHRIAILQEAADAIDPAAAGPQAYATQTAGIRVGLEAGIDGGGPYSLRHRWTLAHTIAPVLAAAFANAPLRHGRPTGWRSARQALRRDLPVIPPGADPRAAWVAYVMDSPVTNPAAAMTTAALTTAGAGSAVPDASGPGPAGLGAGGAGGAGGITFRSWCRSANPPGVADLRRHLESLRPPVAARGHLEIDVADRQPGQGWRVPLAVVAALLDDPQAAAEAGAATASLPGTPRLWERAARDALTDPALAAAARICFVAAYAALARQGVSRDLRDTVAAFTERYVLRGRCPADDVLDRATARP